MMKNLYSPIELLPFQGVTSAKCHVPRVIPWTVSLKPFQGNTQIMTNYTPQRGNNPQAQGTTLGTNAANYTPQRGNNPQAQGITLGIRL